MKDNLGLILSDLHTLIGVACTEAMVNPLAVGNASFKYQKIFGEAEFFAGGILNIQVGGAKAPKNSQDNAYVSCSDETGEIAVC